VRDGICAGRWRADIEPVRSSSQSALAAGGPPPTNLADVLERVLDKGIVIVGDIQVRLLDIELLTIKVRLMIASVDKAKEMGINWWEGDPFVTSVEGQGSNGRRELDSGEQRQPASAPERSEVEAGETGG
jgi:hypothetical protein